MVKKKSLIKEMLHFLGLIPHTYPIIRIDNNYISLKNYYVPGSVLSASLA